MTKTVSRLVQYYYNELVDNHVFVFDVTKYWKTYPISLKIGMFLTLFCAFQLYTKIIKVNNMAGLGIVIVIGAIIASMGAAMFMYTQYETNFIESSVGNAVIVGPVEYVITFEGTHNGDKENVPENTFVMIGITAKNISDKKTVISGGQFYIVDEKDQKHEAVFGEFSANDLFLEALEPNKPIQRTTQFDIPFDEEKQYKIIIRPQKDQSTVDTAVVCLTNC